MKKAKQNASAIKSGLGRLSSAGLLAFALLFVAVSVMAAPDAVAQTAAEDAPLNGAVPGNTTEGQSADAELWRQIRHGAQGTVAGADPSSGLLIQSEGHYWQETRSGPLAMYSAWAMLGVLFLLSVFFALRGRIRIDHGPAGETIKRFTLIERTAHWLLASSFIVLALTGLNITFGRDLLIPLLGKEAFAAATLYGKYIHNYVAFAFMASLALIAILWIAHNLPSRHDIVWLLRGGGILWGGHPAARKFNAGQKILFWVIILCGVSISMSGWALLNPFDTAMFSKTFAVFNSWLGMDLPTNLAPIQEQQYQALWHIIMAVFMICVVIAHIYIGTVGMEGAVDAMTSGDVDINWAKEHHSIWVEEEQAKARAKGESAPGGGTLQPAE